MFAWLIDSIWWLLGWMAFLSLATYLIPFIVTSFLLPEQDLKVQDVARNHFAPTAPFKPEKIQC
jgi:hypothetical protein